MASSTTASTTAGMATWSESLSVSLESQQPGPSGISFGCLHFPSHHERPNQQSNESNEGEQRAQEPSGPRATRLDFQVPPSQDILRDSLSQESLGFGGGLSQSNSDAEGGGSLSLADDLLRQSERVRQASEERQQQDSDRLAHYLSQEHPPLAETPPLLGGGVVLEGQQGDEGSNRDAGVRGRGHVADAHVCSVPSLGGTDSEEGRPNTNVQDSCSVPVMKAVDRLVLRCQGDQALPSTTTDSDVPAALAKKPSSSQKVPSLSSKVLSKLKEVEKQGNDSSPDNFELQSGCLPGVSISLGVAAAVGELSSDDKEGTIPQRVFAGPPVLGCDSCATSHEPATQTTSSAPSDLDHTSTQDMPEDHTSIQDTPQDHTSIQDTPVESRDNSAPPLAVQSPSPLTNESVPPKEEAVPSTLPSERMEIGSQENSSSQEDMGNQLPVWCDEVLVGRRSRSRQNSSSSNCSSSTEGPPPSKRRREKSHSTSSSDVPGWQKEGSSDVRVGSSGQAQSMRLPPSAPGNKTCPPVTVVVGRSESQQSSGSSILPSSSPHTGSSLGTVTSPSQSLKKTDSSLSDQFGGISPLQHTESKNNTPSSSQPTRTRSKDPLVEASTSQNLDSISSELFKDSLFVDSNSEDVVVVDVQGKEDECTTTEVIEDEKDMKIPAQSTPECPLGEESMMEHEEESTSLTQLEEIPELSEDRVRRRMRIPAIPLRSPAKIVYEQECASADPTMEMAVDGSISSLQLHLTQSQCSQSVATHGLQTEMLEEALSGDENDDKKEEREAGLRQESPMRVGSGQGEGDDSGCGHEDSGRDTEQEQTNSSQSCSDGGSGPDGNAGGGGSGKMSGDGQGNGSEGANGDGSGHDGDGADNHGDERKEGGDERGEGNGDGRGNGSGQAGDNVNDSKQTCVVCGGVVGGQGLSEGVLCGGKTCINVDSPEKISESMCTDEAETQVQGDGGTEEELQEPHPLVKPVYESIQYDSTDVDPAIIHDETHPPIETHPPQPTDAAADHGRADNTLTHPPSVSMRKPDPEEHIDIAQINSGSFHFQLPTDSLLEPITSITPNPSSFCSSSSHAISPQSAVAVAAAQQPQLAQQTGIQSSTSRQARTKSLSPSAVGKDFFTRSVTPSQQLDSAALVTYGREDSSCKELDSGRGQLSEDLFASCSETHNEQGGKMLGKICAGAERDGAIALPQMVVPPISSSSSIHPKRSDDGKAKKTEDGNQRRSFELGLEQLTEETKMDSSSPPVLPQLNIPSDTQFDLSQDTNSSQVNLDHSRSCGGDSREHVRKSLFSDVIATRRQKVDDRKKSNLEELREPCSSQESQDTDMQVLMDRMRSRKKQRSEGVEKDRLVDGGPPEGHTSDVESAPQPPVEDVDSTPKPQEGGAAQKTRTCTNGVLAAASHAKLPPTSVHAAASPPSVTVSRENAKPLPSECQAGIPIHDRAEHISKNTEAPGIHGNDRANLSVEADVSKKSLSLPSLLKQQTMSTADRQSPGRLSPGVAGGRHSPAMSGRLSPLRSPLLSRFPGQSLSSPHPSVATSEFVSPSRTISSEGFKELKRNVDEMEGREISSHELRYVHTVCTVIEERFISSEMVENGAVVSGSEKFWPESSRPYTSQEIKVELLPRVPPSTSTSSTPPQHQHHPSPSIILSPFTRRYASPSGGSHGHLKVHPSTSHPFPNSGHATMGSSSSQPLPSPLSMSHRPIAPWKDSAGEAASDRAVLKLDDVPTCRREKSREESSSVMDEEDKEGTSVPETPSKDVLSVIESSTSPEDAVKVTKGKGGRPARKSGDAGRKSSPRFLVKRRRTSKSAFKVGTRLSLRASPRKSLWEERHSSFASAVKMKNVKVKKLSFGDAGPCGQTTPQTVTPQQKEVVQPCKPPQGGGSAKKGRPPRQVGASSGVSKAPERGISLSVARTTRQMANSPSKTKTLQVDSSSPGRTRTSQPAGISPGKRRTPQLENASPSKTEIIGQRVSSPRKAKSAGLAAASSNKSKAPQQKLTSPNANSVTPSTSSSGSPGSSTPDTGTSGTGTPASITPGSGKVVSITLRIGTRSSSTRVSSSPALPPPPPPSSSGPTTPASPMVESSFMVGDAVIARWMTDKRWYAATVKDFKNGRVALHYADGEKGTVAASQLFHQSLLRKNEPVTAGEDVDQNLPEVTGQFESFSRNGKQFIMWTPEGKKRTYSTSCFSISSDTAVEYVKQKRASPNTRKRMSPYVLEQSPLMKRKKMAVSSPGGEDEELTIEDLISPSQHCLFQGYTFFITQKSKEDKQSDDEQPLNKHQVTMLVSNRKGRVLDTYKEERITDGRYFVLSDDCCRTQKFLMGLALAIPCVSYVWITDCIQQGVVLDYTSYRLPAGIPHKGSVPIKWTPRQRSSILKGVQVYVHHPQNVFKEHWKLLLKYSGANVLNKLPTASRIKADKEDDLDIIVVTEEGCHLPCSLTRCSGLYNVTVLGPEWVVQCLVQGRHLHRYHDFVVKLKS